MEPYLIAEDGVFALYLVHEDNLGPLVATFSSRALAERAAAACGDIDHTRASTALLRMRERIEAEEIPYLAFPDEW